jgi:hypothetical protein
LSQDQVPSQGAAMSSPPARRDETTSARPQLVRADQEKATPNLVSLGGRDSRPMVVARPELVEVLDFIEAGIFADPDAGVYTRGDLLVRVVRDPKKIAGITRAQGAAAIAVVSADYLRECIDRAVRMVNKEGDPILPPVWTAKGILARGAWPFPELEGVIETPTLRSDGSILDRPGFDLSTGLLFDPGATEFPAVPDLPNLDDAIEAWGRLRTPFADFPFVSESDFSAWLATLLAVLIRHAIRGPCPMTSFGAPTPGSGKGLAADAVALIATGRVAARTTVAKDDDEMRKRILALAIAADPIVLIDNVVGQFGSASIAATLTSETITDRVLGLSRTATLRVQAVWMLTGNNVQFRGDLGRRVLPCDLDAKMEHPEDRENFRIPNLPAYLLKHRPELVVDALTILRAFCLAGRPPHGRPRKGSFESWDDWVRAPLLWIGAADPLEGQERLRESGDIELDALRSALALWYERFGENAITLAEVLEGLSGDHDPLRAALCELAGREPGKLNATQLGCALRGYMRRIASGLRFAQHAQKTRGVARWRVVRETPSGGDGRDGGGVYT